MQLRLEVAKRPVDFACRRIYGEAEKCETFSETFSGKPRNINVPNPLCDGINLLVGPCFAGWNQATSAIAFN